ncbi:polysaccharide pyruvyl transferase family protein [Priestia megaterium]
MKRVMIYAYTQFNLGDDLFIKVLCERYPKTNFVLYAPSRYKITFKEIKNITFYPSDSIITRGVNYLFRRLGLNEVIRRVLVRRCNAVVQIGGSLFIQGDNWKGVLEHTKAMKPKDKPFYLLGTNFGPYKNNDFYESYKDVFGDYTDICFRDQYSYDLFKDLNNTRLADDIIFQLKTQKNQKQENNIIISVIKPSIRKHLSQYDEVYYDKIKDIAIYFIKKGYYVTLMSFCELEGDKEAVGKIVDLIPSEFSERVKKHYYTTNIEDTLNVMAQSSFIVATRFHSMILGWVFNKPVFPIVYSEKMTNVMKDVGFKGFYTDFKNINNVKPEQVFECIKTNLIDVSKQVDKAEEHFSKLDEYINNDLAKLK